MYDRSCVEIQFLPTNALYQCPPLGVRRWRQIDKSSPTQIKSRWRVRRRQDYYTERARYAVSLCSGQIRVLGRLFGGIYDALVTIHIGETELTLDDGIAMVKTCHAVGAACIVFSPMSTLECFDCIFVVRAPFLCCTI